MTFTVSSCKQNERMICHIHMPAHVITSGNTSLGSRALARIVYPPRHVRLHTRIGDRAGMENGAESGSGEGGGAPVYVEARSRVLRLANTWR